MGRSSKCVGRNLYNHLQQRKIPIDVAYDFDKVKLLWSGRMTVFGTNYQVSEKQNKIIVLETLMENANSFIQSNLSVKKISS